VFVHSFRILTAAKNNNKKTKKQKNKKTKKQKQKQKRQPAIPA